MGNLVGCMPLQRTPRSRAYEPLSTMGERLSLTPPPSAIDDDSSCDEGASSADECDFVLVAANQPTRYDEMPPMAR